MKTEELETVINKCKKTISKHNNGADLADIYVYLGVELGLGHLLQPEALPQLEPTLPTKPPELYQKRADQRERPHMFIRRVYEQWLGKGLAQHHLLHLDRPLYAALHNWLRNNEWPSELDLPSKKELNDRELKNLGLEVGQKLPYPSYYRGLRDKLRLYNAARNRK